MVTRWAIYRKHKGIGEYRLIIRYSEHWTSYFRHQPTIDNTTDTDGIEVIECHDSRWQYRIIGVELPDSPARANERLEGGANDKRRL